MADDRSIDVALLRRLGRTISVWLVGILVVHGVADAQLIAARWGFQLLLLAVLIDAWHLHGFLATRARLARLPEALAPREVAR